MKSGLRLKKLTIKGFKSIDSVGQTVEFGNTTVLLGANGAGKSNLIDFFRMLNQLSQSSLQTFVAEQGFADTFLYFGAKQTSGLSSELLICLAEAREAWETFAYRFALRYAAGDTLFFSDERVARGESDEVALGAGHKESHLLDSTGKEVSKELSYTIDFIYYFLHGCHVYQFHDTSKTARIRNQAYIGSDYQLEGDGGNLAAVLHSFKNNKEWEAYYRRIVERIRSVLPQFGDFELTTSAMNPNYIKLDWTERGRPEYRLGPHQLSDGSLRFMALTTLLLQPPASLPDMIVIDEPELGLHPAAISALAGMVKDASRHCQVVLATQSAQLVDEFEPSDIVIVDRDEANKRSVFRRLAAKDFSEWLERYSLSELWEKNVLGGRP